MANFNNNSGKGRLVVDRYDYEGHVSGATRNHKDTDIRLSSSVAGIPAGGTLHDALSAIGGASSTSDSYIYIGKGYDVYSSGTFNSSALYLDVALTDLFTNTSNPLNSRLVDGGVVVIRAGTYKIGQTVNIPAGVTIMGEGFGTKLINATVAFGASAPMFRVVADTNRYEDLAVVGGDAAYNPFLNARNTVFSNLVISDNYLKPITFGDTTYRAAQNITQPLITMDRGAGLTCQGVTFIGRTALSVPGSTTLTAIQTLSASASSYSTELSIHDCDFDGFNQTIKYTPVHGTLDSFTFRGNRVRNFGPVSNTNTQVNSNVIFANACNISVSNNYLWTNRDLLAILYIDAVTADSTTIQGRSKINVTNNVIASNKPSSGAISFTSVGYNSGLTSTVINNSISTITYGNNVDSTEGFKVKLVGSGSTVLDLNTTSSSMGASTVPLTISSSALTLGTGTTTIQGAATLNSTLLVSGTTTLQGTTISSGSTLSIPSGSILDIPGSVTLGGTLIAGAGSTIQTNAASTLNIRASTTFNCATNIQLNSGAKIIYGNPFTKTVTYPALAMGVGSSWSTYSASLEAVGMGVQSTATGAYYMTFVPIHGATITSVAIFYRLAGSSRTPTSRLRFACYAIPPTTSTGLSNYNAFNMLSTGGFTQVPAYITFGSFISTSITPDQNNVVDTSANNYILSILEESGTGAITGNVISALQVTYSISSAPLG